MKGDHRSCETCYFHGSYRQARKLWFQLNRQIDKPNNNPIAQYAFNNGAIKKNKYFLINTNSSQSSEKIQPLVDFGAHTVNMDIPAKFDIKI